MSILSETIIDLKAKHKTGGVKIRRLDEALKSKKKLFDALSRFYDNNDYNIDQLKHDKISDETYGRKSMIYIRTKNKQERAKLEKVLQADGGFKVDKDYSPDNSTIEVQVSYFKGDKWDV